MKNKDNTPLEIGGVKLYTTKDIAKAMDVTDRTVRRYIRDGHLQAKKVGRNIFITEEALREFINDNK